MVYGHVFSARDRDEGTGVSKAKRECLLDPCIGPGSEWVLNELPTSRDHGTGNQEKALSAYD